MNSTRNTCHYLYDCISNREQFYELVLTQDGSLFIDSALKKCSDSFCIYYNGNVCCMQGGHPYCIGDLPEDYLILPTIVGETSYHNIEDCGCFLHSKQPVLESGTSVFAVFRYQDTLALYMADSMVSKGIFFSVTEYTPEEEVFYTNLFHRMLCRHDPEVAEKVASWLNRYDTHGGEV